MKAVRAPFIRRMVGFHDTSLATFAVCLSVFTSLATRWDDNDIYSHLNNTVHFRLFDTAVNGWLLDRGLLDPHPGETIFLVVETGCSYFAELAYPQAVDVGLGLAWPFIRYL